MTTLQTLADNREEILKAELAALLHNLGKLSTPFITRWTGIVHQNSSTNYAEFNHQTIAQIVMTWWNTNNSSISNKGDRNRLKQKIEATPNPDCIKNFFDSTELKWFQKPQILLPTPLNDRKYTFGDFIEFHKGWHRGWDDPTKASNVIIKVIYSSSIVTNLLHIAHDAASGGEKQDSSNSTTQQTNKLLVSSAFGYEKGIELAELDEKRQKLLDALITSDTNLKEIVQSALKYGLGDTQRPINDITLWDLSFGTASFFKASVVAALLTGTGYSASDNYRFLHVSFDGLNFWSHAHHITDMLGRREALTQGLDAVKQLLEVQYPIGNEIYRDENGSVFIVADKADLLELTDNNQKTLQELIKTAFDSESIYHELEPEIKLSDAYQGKQIKLADILTNRFLSKLSCSPRIEALWIYEEDEVTAKKKYVQEELCPVCEVRPIGSDGQVSSKLDSWANYEKAKARKICRVCLDRRGRRAKTWITNNAEKTVWLQEAADINGRFALIVGRFGLDGWLNGSFIPTTSKSASFARIQRCWETTKNFWEEVQNQCIPSELQFKKQLRLAIKTSGFGFIGNPYAYELEIAGQRLGVCWDETEKCLWTITNLKYFAQQLNLKFSDEESLEKVLSNALKGQTLVKVFESNDSSKKDKEVGTLTIENIIKNEYFTPYIPLVTEPNLFMAIVPAQDILTVTQAVKKKYETEMGRVRDRLPMHLGVVFANRRLPMQAVLEAGRNMLKMPDKSEEWTVESAQSYQLKIKKNEKELEWQYPENMGDGSTPDKWYPHLFTTNENTDFKRVDELNLGDNIFIFPSHFDFEFLDTTVRRFEVIYDENGRRRDKSTRPFLLDDLERFKNIWAEMKKLSASQRMQIITTIESTRELWKSSESDSEKDEVFKQFVKDTLNNAAWKTGEKPEEREFNLLLKAAISGELLDLFELHHEILKEG